MSGQDIVAPGVVTLSLLSDHRCGITMSGGSPGYGCLSRDYFAADQKRSECVPPTGEVDVEVSCRTIMPHSNRDEQRQWHWTGLGGSWALRLTLNTLF